MGLGIESFETEPHTNSTLLSLLEATDTDFDHLISLRSVLFDKPRTRQIGSLHLSSNSMKPFASKVSGMPFSSASHSQHITMSWRQVDYLVAQQDNEILDSGLICDFQKTWLMILLCFLIFRIIR